ncbi:MAG: glycosyltransferase family 2 protein [Rikenellaceae bacterium]
MITLSIVIPVYNGAKYISTCLDSIWCQGLNEGEYEVICVDDCSTDNTYDYLLSLAAAHSNMRVLQNAENLRAGGARNHGVREAKGEYILFIDADDYFHPAALLEAFDYVRGRGLDILMCDNVRHRAGSDSMELIHPCNNQSIVSGVEFIDKNSLPWAPWKYIFKRSLMVDNSVWFIERVSCEDCDWSYALPFYAGRMQYQPILLTHFILGDDSQTASEFRHGDIIWHRFYCARRVWELTRTIYRDNPELWGKLSAVASAQFYQGVLYLNAFWMKAQVKRDILVKYIPDSESFHPLVKFAMHHPMLYAIGSNLISPFFRTAVVVKRKIYKRV